MGRQKADADAAYTALKIVTAVVGQQVNIKKKKKSMTMGNKPDNKSTVKLGRKKTSILPLCGRQHKLFQQHVGGASESSNVWQPWSILFGEQILAVW